MIGTTHAHRALCGAGIAVAAGPSRYEIRDGSLMNPPQVSQ
jgi:hypothetical protein